MGLHNQDRSYSLKLRLYEHLTQTPVPRSEGESLSNRLVDFTDLSLSQISGKLRYRSAIALKIAGQQGGHPRDIAQALIRIFPDCTDFCLEGTMSGSLEWQVQDGAIAQWLEDCLNLGLEAFPLDPLATGTDSSTLFPLQYAYARCCSLLRLAEQDQLIQLNFSSGLFGVWLNPQPVPWLEEDQGYFRLQHIAESSLIAQQMMVVDALVWTATVDWLKLAMQLGEAMLQFYRVCRIWGQVKEENRPLAQARLGLVRVTQILLGLILLQIFGENPRPSL